jgi:hypothetical protein
MPLHRRDLAATCRPAGISGGHGGKLELGRATRVSAGRGAGGLPAQVIIGSGSDRLDERHRFAALRLQRSDSSVR